MTAPKIVHHKVCVVCRYPTKGGGSVLEGTGHETLADAFYYIMNETTGDAECIRDASGEKPRYYESADIEAMVYYQREVNDAEALYRAALDSWFQETR